MVWWVPLAAMAANLLSKEQERKRAEKLDLQKALYDIKATRAQQLGAQPYSGIVDRMAIDSAARRAGENNAGDSIGMALQAYSALDDGFGGKSSTPSSGEDIPGKNFSPSSDYTPPVDFSEWKPPDRPSGNYLADQASAFELRDRKDPFRNGWWNR